MPLYCLSWQVDCFHRPYSRGSRRFESRLTFLTSINHLIEEFGKSADIHRLQSPFKSEKGSQTWECAHEALSLLDQRRALIGDEEPS